nr:MAG TPA: hypothetical protein [Caudoviricetes sp.]
MPVTKRLLTYKRPVTNRPFSKPPMSARYTLLIFKLKC